jgi:enoyl-CoA hydratase
MPVEMLVELNEAILRAEADDGVRVVILGGVGSMFSAGYDMGTKEAVEERSGGHPSYLENGGTRKGAEEVFVTSNRHNVPAGYS